MDIDVSIRMLLIAILLYTIWWNHKKIQANIFRCKFFELRSKLRDLLISEKVAPDSKLFLYLDQYITSIITDMSVVNIYKSIIMSSILKKRASKISSDEFKEFLKSNPLLADIFNELVSLLTQYSIRKHFITLVLLAFISMPFIKSLQFIREFSSQVNSKMKLNYRIYEETLAVIG